jgi:hypothetical protein
MGKLVVTEFVSVDGVFEDPRGAEDYEHGGWTFEYDRGDEGDKFKLDELMEAEAHLLGGRGDLRGLCAGLALPRRPASVPGAPVAGASSARRGRATAGWGRTWPEAQDRRARCRSCFKLAR